jgi:outer membrane lipoprotein-sorting protein
MKRFIIIIAILISYLLGQTGLEIAQKIDGREAPKDMKVNLTMLLTNKKGKTRSSTLRSISKDDATKQIIWFLAPADDKGVAFLKIEHNNGDDEMRLWLPAFNKIRRISSSQKSDSFMGSDMSYEDMTSREIEEYNYNLLGEEELDGVLCYKLESTPKPSMESTYSKFIGWVTKDKFLVLKEESYDKSDRLIKIRTIKYKEQKGYIVPNEIFVKNVQKNHSTRLTFDEMELDTNVNNDLFQEKNLKRLPR